MYEATLFGTSVLMFLFSLMFLRICVDEHFGIIPFIKDSELVVKFGIEKFKFARFPAKIWHCETIFFGFFQ